MAVTAPPQETYSGGGELLWPGDPRIALAEAAEARRGRGWRVTGWPVTLTEICPISDSTRDSTAKTTVTEGVALHELCREATPPLFHARATAGAFALRPLSRAPAPFETFDPGWGSVRFDPEFARAWADLPPLLSLELGHAFSPSVFAYFRMGLRRDLAAWAEDDLASNLPLSDAEVDLNEPSLGYLSYSGDWLDLAVGRFPIHWGPSPEFGLALSSSVPYHNAVQAVLKAPRLRYRFLVSSLNPWLQGTPPGDTSGTAYPVGSEEWRQRNYPVLPGSENAHRRVYDARIKTLIAHRLETWAGPFAFGITETQVIGGKVPDLRDANPFAVFHNDFHEGYANNNVSVDALARLPAGVSLGAEIFLDDLEWSATEGEGSTPSLVGWLGMVRHVFRLRGWSVDQSLHAIYTDPFLYGFLQPLNTYASRHVLTSNFRGPGSDPVVDKLVVDYPLGYLRGGDALDFWYRARAERGRQMAVACEAALLSRGEVRAGTPYAGYFLPHGSAPSGAPERELRLSTETEWEPLRGLRLVGGLGWRDFLARGARGRGGSGFLGAAGLSVTWP